MKSLINGSLKDNKTTGAPLFIESSSRQAAEIAKLSGKCVFCFETREMVHPDRLPQGVPRNGRTISHFLRLKEQRIRQAMNNFLKG